MLFLSRCCRKFYYRILKHTHVKTPKRWPFSPSMMREYCSFGHVLMSDPTELHHSKLNKNRAFQISEGKSNKSEFRKQQFRAHTWFSVKEEQENPLGREKNVPFFLAVSSGSRFLVTVTTFSTRWLPPCRIMFTTCLWPTFTTFSLLTCTERKESFRPKCRKFLFYHFDKQKVERTGRNRISSYCLLMKICI